MILPVVADAGKITLNSVGVLILIEAFSPLKATVVVLSKPVPFIVISASEPAQALVGEKLVMVWAKLVVPIKQLIIVKRVKKYCFDSILSNDVYAARLKYFCFIRGALLKYKKRVISCNSRIESQ